MSIESMPDLAVINRERQISQIRFWASRFNFLNETNGIRPARVTYCLGTTGTGKSTLICSIVADCAMDSKILIILSEENAVRYSDAIYKSKPNVNKENIIFVLEKNIPEAIRGDQKKIWAWLELYIVESGVRLVFWDNLTSSSIFSQSFGNKGQEWAVQKIRDFCESMQIAFFIVMHTSKDITDNMGRYIEGEDVRGTQQSFIGADFFYVFQRFSVGKVFYPFIRIVKHRGFNPKDKVFLLYFANETYIKDTVSSFEEMNEIFMQRNTLGKNNQKPKALSNGR